MAEVTPVITSIGKNDSTFKAVIAALTTTNDRGTPIDVSDFDVESVQFNGTPGVGGTFSAQGSNDKTNWFALTDPQGNAITKTAAALEQVTERCHWIRPFVSAGDGSTDIDATFILRKVRQIQA
ncbi:hypothetical protein KAR91_08705 [Candidatus Pacearchaeota archaeon]|nr:hypothetical protein [Candidatus Pacearchaeota archaeon]